ncbi:ABC transporter ATP-binding protein [Nonomuraea dietziae]|uniref:ABC-type glutathione transport system ATPase component n=1 Tax=Nonomuraea dietziae TaxID=65515 RepID=A0A7W5V611_9ACTN|nr:ABC transporter ATP-binding protein [Nonomuraea dietziae]MBB3731247.1 ABC-type glutathione transport system ATPase component [Nonomuraea dietziae]
MIRVRDLRVAYGDRVVAEVPELDVGRGECVAIVGESGSGKSTTLLALLGLTEGARVSGEVSVCGVDVMKARPRALRAVRGAKAALVIQSPQAALSPTTRLGVLMRRALRLHGVTGGPSLTGGAGSTGGPGTMGKGARGIDAVMAQACEAVLLDPAILRRYPHEISGGQAQRFAIAMAIALGAEVILADEPTSALDVTVQAEVVGVLRGLREERGLAVLLVSHDLALVSTIADRVLVMKDGVVVESGPARHVLRDPDHPYTRELLEALP